MPSSPNEERAQSASGSSSSPQSLSKATLHSSFKRLHYRVANRFRLKRRLGGGAFGDVYNAVDVVSNEVLAVKLEPTQSSHQPHLQHEARLYAYLQKSAPVSVGIPKVRWFGREGDYNIMVMELLGPSLEDLFEFCGRHFDIKTVLMLAAQMLSRLEFLHALNYLHRDLKPENFAMGLGKRSHHCYVLDLGLAKRFRDTSGKHIPYLDGKSLTGTARYVSINTHLGVQQSRRDDLEALAMVLIYFARSGLPWQGVKCPTKQAKYERIKQLKMQTSSQALCERLPSAFLVFLMYTRSLGFEESPDYARCRKLFSDALEDLGFEMDYQFAWLKYRTAPATSTSSPTPSVGSEQSRSSSGMKSPSASTPRGSKNSGIVYPKLKSSTSSQQVRLPHHTGGHRERPDSLQGSARHLGVPLAVYHPSGANASETASAVSRWGGTTGMSISGQTEVSRGPLSPVSGTGGSQQISFGVTSPARHVQLERDGHPQRQLLNRNSTQDLVFALDTSEHEELHTPHFPPGSSGTSFPSPDDASCTEKQK